MGGGASHGATLTEEQVWEAVAILKSGNVTNHHTTLLPLVAAAGNEANSFLLCDPSFEFVPSLVHVLSTDSGFMRSSALLIFQNLSCFFPHQAYLCSPDVGLIRCLLSIIKSSVDVSIVTGSCRILHNLVAPTAAGVNTTCELCANYSDYFPILVTRLKEMKHPEISKGILGILRCYFKLTYLSQLCRSHRLIPLLCELMTTPSLQDAVVMLRLLSIHGDERIAEELLEASLPSIGLLVLAEAGTNTSQWLVTKSAAEWLVFLLYAARFPAIATALRENNGINVFTPLSVLPACEGSVSLKASILLAFLCGRDEAVRGQTSAVNETIINLLIDALNSSLDGIAFGADAAGVFRIPLLLSAFNTMIISDSNKRAFAANDRVLPLLKKVLSRVLQSSPAVDAVYGGGMCDSQYECLALSTVLNMSFVDDDVVNEHHRFMNAESGVLELVTAVSHKAGLSEEGRHTARLLMSKLDPTVPEAHVLASPRSPRGASTSSRANSYNSSSSRAAVAAGGGELSPRSPLVHATVAYVIYADEVAQHTQHSSSSNNNINSNSSSVSGVHSASHPTTTTATSSSSSHMTINNGTTAFPSRDIVEVPPVFSSGNTPVNKSGSHIMLSYCFSQKRFATKLAAELKLLGYDVWRDEEGSHLVPRMNGAFDDDMLAKALESASHVIICVSRAYKESQFCRVEANYANQLSRTDRLQMHYVMLESDYTPVSKGTSCNGWLGLMIGDDPWLPGFHDAALCASALKLSQIFGRDGYMAGGSAGVGSSLSANGFNANAAYAVLLDTELSDTPQEVEGLLRRLGVKCAHDLEYLEPENVQDLATMLKMVGKKKFLQAMNVAATATSTTSTHVMTDKASHK